MKEREVGMKEEDRKRCGICKIPYFERNNYYFGKLMTVRDYSDEQCYFNEKRWLISRMVNGWGVVCGLDVKPKEDDGNKVIITPGLAIDCCGREILICEKQEVILTPEDSKCSKQKAPESGGKEKLLICLEYHECRTEPVYLPPIACDKQEKGEFNRIRDSFTIRVRRGSEVDTELPYGSDCPLMDKSASLHDYFCQKLKQGCPSCPERSCLVLAEITLTDPESLTIKIDTCSKRRLVYSNPALYDLIRCLHYNYIGTWLVLGPIFNVNHQGAHFPDDGHPSAKDIINGFDTNVFNPKEITGDSNKAPEHGRTIHYENTALNIRGEYEWHIRNFLGMDWMNIHDIEDNIHQHLPGNYSDPFDPANPLNFSGKHHALSYFLVYILSPEQRETRLFVRSDDSLKVWLNGQEIAELQYAGERDIKDFTEAGAQISLNAGCNILMASVAEAHYEWGFSARIEHDGGMRFTPIKPV